MIPEAVLELETDVTSQMILHRLARERLTPHDLGSWMDITMFNAGCARADR
jgi:hypothetical protein